MQGMAAQYLTRKEGDEQLLARRQRDQDSLAGHDAELRQARRPALRALAQLTEGEAADLVVQVDQIGAGGVGDAVRLQ